MTAPQDFDVVGEQVNLALYLARVQALNDHELVLLRLLETAQARRADADRSVTALIKRAEESSLDADQWRALLNGRHSDVSASCARRSLSKAGH